MKRFYLLLCMLIYTTAAHTILSMSINRDTNTDECTPLTGYKSRCLYIDPSGIIYNNLSINRFEKSPFANAYSTHQSQQNHMNSTKEQKESCCNCCTNITKSCCQVPEEYVCTAIKTSLCLNAAFCISIGLKIVCGCPC